MGLTFNLRNDGAAPTAPPTFNFHPWVGPTVKSVSRDLKGYYENVGS